MKHVKEWHRLVSQPSWKIKSAGIPTAYYQTKRMKHGRSNSTLLNETWANQSDWGTWWKKVESNRRFETWGLMRDLLERILLRSPEHENTGLESVSNIQVEQRRLPAYLKAKTEIIWAIEKENESRRAPPRDLRGLMRGLLEMRIFSNSDRRSEIDQRLDGWK